MKSNFLIVLFAFFQGVVYAQVNKAGKGESTSVLHYNIAEADSVEVFAVLDSFMANFKQPLEKYLPGHLKTYLFPHVRIASGAVSIIANKDSMPVSYWQARMPADWDHSAWVSRTIVQASGTKVHLVNVFRRFREDNSIIADETSLYIMEKVDGKWGIRGRSSFAK